MTWRGWNILYVDTLSLTGRIFWLFGSLNTSACPPPF